MATVSGAMATYEDYELCWPVPSAAKLPIELDPPDGFDPPDISTWPRVEGRLEYIDGRLLYMPPCASWQGLVGAETTALFAGWARKHGDFQVFTLDIGMVLGRDVLAADVAVWRKSKEPLANEFRRTPPLIAVEVAGKDDAEDESALLRKARRYLRYGVKTIWLVLPETREVVVVRRDRTKRFEKGDTLPTPPELPGLVITVDEIFRPL